MQYYTLVPISNPRKAQYFPSDFLILFHLKKNEYIFIKR